MTRDWGLICYLFALDIWKFVMPGIYGTEETKINIIMLKVCNYFLRG